MPIVSKIERQQRECDYRSDDVRDDQVTHRVEGHRSERVDLLGDLHDADLRCQRGARTPGNHERGKYGAQFPDDAQRDGGPQHRLGAEFPESVVDLQGEDHPGEGPCQKYYRKRLVSEEPQLPDHHPELEGRSEYHDDRVRKKDETAAETAQHREEPFSYGPETAQHRPAPLGLFLRIFKEMVMYKSLVHIRPGCNRDRVALCGIPGSIRECIKHRHPGVGESLQRRYEAPVLARVPLFHELKQGRTEIGIAAVRSERTPDHAAALAEKLAGVGPGHAEIVVRNLLAESEDVYQVFMGMVGMPVDAADISAVRTGRGGMPLDVAIQLADDPGNLCREFPDPEKEGVSPAEEVFRQADDASAVASLSMIEGFKKEIVHDRQIILQRRRPGEDPYFKK